MTKVLVVDDATIMRLRCSRLLTEAGYEVVEAQNGEEAVNLYMKERPALVLMDITMPVMDGIAATQTICQGDPKARVVMLSAAGQQWMVKAALEAGARDFIVKPFEAEQVLNAVRRYTSAPVTI